MFGGGEMESMLVDKFKRWTDLASDADGGDRRRLWPVRIPSLKNERGIESRRDRR